jgi:hypothetical protein
MQVIFRKKIAKVARLMRRVVQSKYIGEDRKSF